MASGQGRSRSGSGRSTASSGRNGSKSTAGKNRSGSSRSREKSARPMDSAIRSEIILIALLALAVVLFLCNFGIVGSVGDAVSGFLFGIFGLMAYVAPVLLFLAVAFGMSNSGDRIAARKLVSGVVLFVLVSMVCELFSADLSQTDAYRIGEIYGRCRDGHNGGGVIGGTLVYLSCRFLGVVGTVVVILVLAIICMVIVTEKSFIGGVRKHGQRVYERSVEDAAYRRERARERQLAAEEKRARQQEERRRREEEQENEKILRMDKKVSGVMIDTSLGREDGRDREEALKTRDDIHEIMLHTDETDEEDGADESSALVGRDVSSRHAIGDGPDGFHGIRIHGAAEDIEEEDEAESAAAASSAETETPWAAGRTAAKPAWEARQESAAIEPERAPKPNRPYKFPPVSLLHRAGGRKNRDSAQELRETAERLRQTLDTFGVKVTITDISQGPSVTRYEMQPEMGVKVSKIVGLADDIKLNLAATDIRIEAPIPGKAAVGIEVPNKENSAVAFRDLVESKEFKEFPSDLVFAVGKDIGGKIVMADIAKMPHMLIAGATGSGKSVCINTIIMGILYKAKPEDVRLIMIDPKVVELSVYNGIPHLLIPVVTDPKKAASALHWGVAEMTDRYKKFADFNVRDLNGYNKKVESLRAQGDPDAPEKLPKILIVVDELADLMMVAPGEVEESICRLAQLARACGIHLIIATQRPSVDVITGLIKANMPSRVAFAVSSGVDSRTILDMVGAEKLLGKGDMLFYPQGYPKPARIQGAFVSDKEVADVVDFLKEQAAGNGYDDEVESRIKNIESGAQGSASGSGDSGSEYDQYFAEAGRFIIEKDKASIGMLQRVFKIGFNRAARIMDQLCEAGVVGEEEGTKPRKVLMSAEQFEQFIEETV